MLQIRNIYTVTSQLEDIVASCDTAAIKEYKTESLIESAKMLLARCQIPPIATTLRELAKKISSFSPASAARLRKYGDEIYFPSELIGQIVSEAVQEYPLRDIKIWRAGQTIHFVQPYGNSFTYLDISRIRFTAEKMQSLLSCLSNLQTLIARRVGSAGALTILNSQQLTKLRRLDLAKNQIEGTELISFASSPNFVKLRWLNLSYNPLHFTGAKAIAKKIHLANLLYLDLWGTGIGNARGFPLLMEAPFSVSLKAIDLGMNGLSSIRSRIFQSCFIENFDERVSLSKKCEADSSLGEKLRKLWDVTLQD
jgi:hypothetical protein